MRPFLCNFDLSVADIYVVAVFGGKSISYFMPSFLSHISVLKVLLTCKSPEQAGRREQKGAPMDPRSQFYFSVTKCLCPNETVTNLLSAPSRGLSLMQLSSGFTLLVFLFSFFGLKAVSILCLLSLHPSKCRWDLATWSSIASPFGLSKAMNVIRALNPSEDMQICAFKRFTFILHRP